MGLLARTISEETAISVENQFLHPVYLTPAEGIPLSLGIGAFMDKKIESWRCRTEKESSTISSAVWIQYTNVTDGRTPADSKDRSTA